MLKMAKQIDWQIRHSEALAEESTATREEMLSSKAKRKSFFPPSLFPFFHNICSAFTLAEVLITLGIIGVVAAMTIPTLVNDYQESVLENQFKETYSIISQAYISAVQEQGTIDGWTSALETYTNLKPYIKINKECISVSGCSPSKDYIGMKGHPEMNLSGPNSGGNPLYKMVLSNGAIISLTGGGINVLNVDINGEKAPNQMGHDFFLLELQTKNGSPFVGWYALTAQNWCSKTLDNAGWWDGGSCAYWVIKHGNMDYLHKEPTAAEWAN